MEEQLISFETAQLAKEKGFPQLNEGVYFTKDKEHCLVGWGFNDRTEDSFAQYSAPTQSLLQKWLREEHKLHIWIESDTFIGKTWGHMFNTNFTAKEITDELEKDETIIFNSYEEALEKALYHMLKLI